jgi:hypothetical protein
LRRKRRCGTVVHGKGAEAQGPRSKDRDTGTEINLTEPTLPQVHHFNTKEDHHGLEEEESSEEEVEVIDRPGLVLGPPDLLQISRDRFDLAQRPDQGSAAFVFGEAFADAGRSPCLVAQA